MQQLQLVPLQLHLLPLQLKNDVKLELLLGLATSCMALAQHIVFDACPAVHACFSKVPVRLIGVHPPVIGVRSQIGKGLTKVESACCLEVFLQVSEYEHGRLCQEGTLISSFVQ